ncbi:MAG TPA: carboxypeptidase-like regulatory domain-containing protein, partial [Bacillota bacterium]|nr:carboxypeptidase-like regulatory domain-containing protein [Bacillota bacterium]
GLPMGLYTLTLDKTGFMTQEISLNVTAAMTYTVDTVILVPGATTEPVSVTGKVFDPADTPVVSCMVIFEPMFDWGYTRVTYTNEEGKFTIPSMIAGYYTVTLSKSTAYVDTYYDVDLTVGGESYDLGVLTIQTP